jgi:hypothetical protein
MFSFTNFAFVNIDDSHVLFYFFTAIAILLLLRYRESGKIRLLYIASLMSAIQIYFSIYVFVYGTLVFLIFFIYANNYFKNITLKKTSNIALCFLSYFLIVLPFIIFYWQIRNPADVYVPESSGWNDIISNAYLKFKDFFRVMPNNPIYNSKFTDSDLIFSFFEIRKSAFTGTLLMGTGIFFMIKNFKKFLPWVIVFLVGLILSTYPYKFLSTKIEILQIVRLPYRAYIISVLSLSVIAILGVTESLKGISNKKQIFVLSIFLLFHFAENIPYPFPLSDYTKLKTEVKQKYNIELGDGFKSENLIPDQALINSIKSNTDKNSVILCLPSNRIFGGDVGMLTYNRELIYMNHQTYFKTNMFNGVHGYFPLSRIEIQEYINQLPDERALLSLSDSGMTHIIFYKNLVLDSEDNIIGSLKKTELLNIVEETKEYLIFELKD